MHKNIVKLLEQIETRVTTAANETVEELAIEAADMVKEQTPAARKKTRQSVRWKRLAERRAVVGLFFAERFLKNKKAFTFRMFSDMWRQNIRPRLTSRLIKKLNSKLQR
jgi:hypothetical protein